MFRLLTLLLLAAVATGADAGDLYVYPAEGQSDQQLADDRFECHQWAVRESGFDPSLVTEAPPRIVRVPVPENEAEGAREKGIITGAIAGGILGATDDHAGRGAALGAAIGALIGSEIEKQGERKAVAAAEAEAEQLRNARSEIALLRSHYRRALTACLEGRGYTVR
ncbi:MAG: glycine zipper domain-containing protein [Xanthomonadales bacterium]|nr:glycine zipper domain-containing protein [Xanthomonadales bacterium]